MLSHLLQVADHSKRAFQNQFSTLNSSLKSIFVNFEKKIIILGDGSYGYYVG
jgi:hypothetical protein